MSDFKNPVTLGQTGMTVGRLGVSGGYGAPAAAFEKAFERGCNFFYNGSMRRKGMNEAIRNLCAKGKREQLIIVDQIYTRSVLHMNHGLNGYMKKLGLDYIDVLLLGWYNGAPSKRILDACFKLKEQGRIRCLAISGHNRKAFPAFAESGNYGLLQLRYNAAHRGAETEVFPKLPAKRPGIVIYTATSWGKLLNPKKTPKELPVPRASDCYRFVLTHPSVDVCITGPKDMAQMDEALTTLERGPMSAEELAWMRQVGDRSA